MSNVGSRCTVVSPASASERRCVIPSEPARAERAVGAAQPLGHRLVRDREVAHVQLVDGLVHRVLDDRRGRGAPDLGPPVRRVEVHGDRVRRVEREAHRVGVGHDVGLDLAGARHVHLDGVPVARALPARSWSPCHPAGRACRDPARRRTSRRRHPAASSRRCAARRRATCPPARPAASPRAPSAPTARTTRLLARHVTPSVRSVANRSSSTPGICTPVAAVSVSPSCRVSRSAPRRADAAAARSRPSTSRARWLGQVREVLGHVRGHLARVQRVRRRVLRVAGLERPAVAGAEVWAGTRTRSSRTQCAACCPSPGVPGRADLHGRHLGLRVPGERHRAAARGVRDVGAVADAVRPVVLGPGAVQRRP